MGISDHPWIDAIKKQTGVEDDDEVNRTMDWNFLSCDARTRQTILAEQEKILSDEDGTSIRAKAQLLNTHRRLSDAHEMMRRAGR